MPDKEIEIVGLAALGGWLAGEEEAPPPEGARCANCQTLLQGPYCHRCGQVADDFHRSIWELIKEVGASFTNIDSKLLRTVPRLLFQPARLTNDYLAGKRARQVPPLRMFLVVVLLFFLTGGGDNMIIADNTSIVASPNATGVRRVHPQIGLAPIKLAVGNRAIENWVNPRINYALSHKEEFARALSEWPHRIAILLMPIAALILGLMYLFSRRFYLFDHLIFSMHSLSFMGLLASAGAAIGQVRGIGGLVGLMFLIPPAHLFIHMRGVYGSGVFGTLLRMAFLFFGSAVAFLLLIVVAVAAGVMSMPGGSS